MRPAQPLCQPVCRREREEGTHVSTEESAERRATSLRDLILDVRNREGTGTEAGQYCHPPDGITGLPAPLK